MMARNVIQSLAQRGAGQSQQGGPQGAAPEMASQMLGSKLNELQGADPGAILRKLSQMKQDLIGMIPFVAFGLPGVSKHVTNMWKALDGAIKEAEQAVSTQSSVEATPVGMSAARPQPDTSAGGGIPGGGGSPFQSGSAGAGAY